MKQLLFALPLVAISTVALADAHSEMTTATAALKGADGTDHGTVTLTQMDGAVLLHAELKNVPEGGHGFHIHENGTCSPDFDAAGGHYNPGDTGHGFVDGGPHAGDMANVFADADGNVMADVINARVTLETDMEASLFDDNGSAIILHENPDTYAKDAGAGGRIACGVISR